jgi:hypothetical protein
MKIITKSWLVLLSLITISSALAEMPAQIKGSWVIDAEGSEAFMKTSPKWDAAGAKFLPTILKRMAQVTYAFEGDNFVVAMRGKEHKLPVTLVKSEGNTHIFEAKRGEKVMTITVTLNDKDQLNVRSSGSDDMDYYLWKRGEMAKAGASDEKLAVELLKKVIEQPAK